jgi:hypothetical protein
MGFVIQVAFMKTEVFSVKNLYVIDNQYNWDTQNRYNIYVFSHYTCTGLAKIDKLSLTLWVS